MFFRLRKTAHPVAEAEKTERSAAPDEQLLAASKKGDREAAVAALRRGAPPNCKHPATGASPLHYAAAAGSITVMVLLLEHGAKVNARDHEDARPLHWAARAGQAAVVRAMCANLAVCLDCRNCSGEAALHWAVKAGNIQAAVALVECGASLASTDKQRRTPLHLAAGNPAMCAVLGLAAQEHALQLRKGAVVGPDLYPVLITVVR